MTLRKETLDSCEHFHNAYSTNFPLAGGLWKAEKKYQYTRSQCMHLQQANQLFVMVNYTPIMVSDGDQNKHVKTQNDVD